MTQYIQSTINEKISARYIIHYYKTMIKNKNLKTELEFIISQNFKGTAPLFYNFL